MVSEIRIVKSMLGVSLAALTIFLFAGTSKPSGTGSELAAGRADAASIVGVVKFPDDYPEREKITVTKDQATCGAFKYGERFVVSDINHGLKNVVVTVQGARGKIKAPDAPVTLDQTKCQYTPHVQAVPVGSDLNILNNDGLLHNVHAYFDGTEPKNTVFNKAQPKFLKKISQKLDKAGVYHFKCDVHDHMSAYIVVMDNPYYAVTNEMGEFSIPKLRPGSYKVQAWHEILGTLEREVTVEAGKSSEVVFDILPN